MRRFAAFFAAAGVVMVTFALAAPPLLHQDFEKDDTGWIVFGGEGKIQVTHDAALVKNGKGALEFQYEASGVKPALAGMPIKLPITGMKSLSFWLMADSQIAAAAMLSEKNGGRYIANFWLEANTWQRVELTPEDFILGTGANDPKDPDGKLDLDQIQSVGVLDTSQIIAASVASRHAPLVVEERAGSHKMWMDDFEISSVAPSWNTPRPAFLIDDFRAPQVNWVTLGGANLKIDASKALRVDVSEMPDRYTVLTHMLPALDLTGATHIGIDIAAEKPAHLVISIQEKTAEPEGPRYHAELELPGGNKMEHRELALSDFELDDKGPPDPNHKLDLDKLKLFSIVDVTGAFTGQEGVNSMRITKIEAVTRK